MTARAPLLADGVSIEPIFTSPPSGLNIKFTFAAESFVLFPCNVTPPLLATVPILRLLLEVKLPVLSKSDL